MTIPPFEATLETHSADLGRYLRAAVGPDDADDCLQETLIAALRAYPRLRRSSDVRAWLFTIARNKALDVHRARRRRAIPVGDPPETASRETQDGDAELWTLVAALPEKQRSAVALRFVADLSHREIATALRCSEEAARRSLHEGLSKLRKELA